ncbi:sugar ABC transporter permease [Youhaiella tibetensis]|uniref:Carbohydrate ABC transporter permease n=1 Tax=Paradevosia tibetensis TaxID=1447062 RepID=A0A5B9DL34_9HYPH|nr:carbohydrate ABC transporter permease [Youhaiella tibetensis]GGF28545.1 sugar ABC transporter permease [Youhaiella tibetensis]
MSAVTEDNATAISQRQLRTIKAFDIGGAILAIVTLVSAIIWAFPLYWGVMTTFKPEFQVVEPGFNPWPRTFTLDAYIHILTHTNIGLWYLNSLVTSLAVTVLVVIMGAGAGYAISQLSFPGRKILWFMILASFMVPIQALIVNHFVLMSQFKLINNWLGVILPQLIVPVVVIVYKQFFDSVPKEFREAAVMDSASEFRMLFKIFLPMNWGVTTALAIITFIGAWNSFLWPFLITTKEEMMNVTVGITQVRDSFGVQYARELAAAVLAGLPVAVVYLIFQRRVTQAIMLSAGIKG